MNIINIHKKSVSFHKNELFHNSVSELQKERNFKQDLSWLRLSTAELTKGNSERDRRGICGALDVVMQCDVWPVLKIRFTYESWFYLQSICIDSQISNINFLKSYTSLTSQY